MCANTSYENRRQHRGENIHNIFHNQKTMLYFETNLPVFKTKPWKEKYIITE